MAVSVEHRGEIAVVTIDNPLQEPSLPEVSLTDHVDPVTAATALALGKRLGKISVPAGVCDGFIGDRIMSPTGARWTT